MDVLTFNLNNPSRERAERQLSYLTARPEQVLVLTETAPSAGCEYLASRFTRAGYHVRFPVPERGERGVMVVSRLALVPSGIAFGYLPHRGVAVNVETETGPLEVLGLYVPSRDATAVKTQRKMDFLREAYRAIPSGDDPGARIVLGDFNILEPNHQPRYPFFQPFEYGFYSWLVLNGYQDAFRYLHPDAAEYSWVGRTGDGYRYDHAHVSAGLADSVLGCLYLHEPRTMANRLTDHSGLTVSLDLVPAAPLPVVDPTSTAETALF
ncbi:endonuclease/exonuclease/phosphatase family protein [Streptomyces cylindrosporus]|uniref:Endonuclease/exonuclease/phosphatase n=1 Tax=Streptomyces cylindrosporus TaxID=2927583 RepID=A0ABS9YK96_9ACTN|nr:endonuclease/exonuclease/phosphatase family protein [Streptomyces cylindrosporus]MCI3277672.1 endonuclease/exonuclease/phosphatase [Streptomyces cylindrosporus]